ncbi:MAG: hypothetical protein QOH06_1258 [Acidobacteriota bacterium]|jgi:hypothetical protein|nr:hypothetical protein [Acidobacteriota bacterium]
MSRTVRAFAALVLTVLFLTSPVAAASRSQKSDAQSFWDSAWRWLVELVLPEGPNSGPKPTDPRPNGDAGGTIDPDGKPGT